MELEWLISCVEHAPAHIYHLQKGSLTHVLCSIIKNIDHFEHIAQFQNEIKTKHCLTAPTTEHIAHPKGRPRLTHNGRFPCLNCTS